MNRASAWGVGALIAITIGAAQAAEPRSGETAAPLQEGKQVFAKWCAPCHAANPRLAGTLALRTRYGESKPAALEDRTDLDPSVTEYFVRNGIAWMPPFRPTEITDAQLAALSAYLAAPLDQRGAHAELLAEEMLARKGAGQ
jgi:mono/diheme cytochrome c family protein